jgi:hypothetical protein
MFDIKFFIIIGLVIVLLFMFKEINSLKTSIENINHKLNNQQNIPYITNNNLPNLPKLPNESCHLTSIIEEETVHNTTNNLENDDNTSDDDQEMMLLLKNDDNVVENYSNDNSESATSLSENSKLKSLTTKSITKSITYQKPEEQHFVVENLEDKSTNNINNADYNTDKSSDKFVDKSQDKSQDKSVDKSIDKSVDNSQDKSPDKLEENLEENLEVSIIDKNSISKLDPEKLIREKKLAELQDMAERLNIELSINGKKKTKIQLANEICNNNV